MLGKLKRAVSKEGGQSLVIGIFVFAALTASVAISLDFGVAYGQRARLQGAADSASLAAADILAAGGSINDVTNAAVNLAAANGYANSDPDTTVTVNVPPSTGLYAGDSDYVEVIIDRENETHFASVLGFDFWTVNSRSVAGGVTGPGANYAIISLNSSNCNALDVRGNVEITIVNGGTMINSSCATSAFYTNGSVDISTDFNHVVGGWSLGGANVLQAPTNSSAVEDTLANVPIPTPPSGPTQSCSFSNGMNNLEPGLYNCTINPNGNQDIVFAPGDYLITGGIVVTGNNDITFGAGVYTLRGQGLTLSGNGTVTTDEVMFYVDVGSVDVTGNGAYVIAAPTTGTYANIAIFQNRSNTNQIDFGGNSFANGNGAIYAAGAQIRLHGTPGTMSIQFISDTFTTVGTVNITILFDDDFTAGGGLELRLVE